MRLNRYLSSCGLGSRRGCEQLVLEERVKVNGKVCSNLATLITDADEVVVDGKTVKTEKGIVIAFHKPKGFVCSRRDERDRETIYALLPPNFGTLHHIGRLDKDSEGLLLLSNRGDVTQRLMHPSQGIEKEYEVILEERFDPLLLTKLIDGFHTDEGKMKAERAWMISDYKLGIVLKQGLKRQIRQMLYFLGHEVKRLVRVRIGNLSIKGLREGAWKEISEAEVERLLLNPLAKDRPKLSTPKTAAIKRLSDRREGRTEPRRRKSKMGKRAAKSSSDGGDSKFRSSAPRRGGSRSKSQGGDKPRSRRPSR